MAIADSALIDLVRNAGVELRERGTMLIGTCPLHSADEQQELEVDPQRGTWTCVACEQRGADAIAWVARTEGVSRRHAIELVRAGTPLHGKALRRERGGRGSGVVKASTVRSLAVAFDTDDNTTLLDHVVDHYHRSLVDDSAALARLARRGLGSADIVARFRLGLANRTLGLHLPQKNRRAGAVIRARLQRLGVLRPTGHEALNGSIVVPLVDATGRVVQLCGLDTSDGLAQTMAPRVWLRDDRHGLLDPGPCRSGELVVTASVIDALAIWAAGHHDVTSIHDCERDLDELCRVIDARAIRQVVLAARRGSDSERTIAKVRERLAATGLRACDMPLDPAMNCDDLARTLADAQLKLRDPHAAIASPGIVAATESPPNDAAAPAPALGNEDELVFVSDDRRWRIRGLASNKARGTLRVNVLVSREQVGFHVDVFDLCSARHRATFVRMAADELRVSEPSVKKDIGQVLLALEHAQDNLLRRTLEPTSTVPVMTESQRTAALELLRDPNLLDRVLDDLESVGVVGERDNLLVAYLASISRKLAAPLAVVVQSSAAAGKSSLVQAVISLVPPEDRVVYSAMTGQSLYYMGSKDLRHKVLCVAEDRGVERASYALKLLQSDGALTIASTGKDAGSGRLVSQEYRVEGPVAIMTTTTAVDLDDELLSRCLVLAVDESPAQTRRIHRAQRTAQTREGLAARARREQLLALHHDAQRLLRSVCVVNAHAEALSFSDLRVRARRDHRKLLALVEAIAMLHQHQRPSVDDADGGSVELVEAQPADLALAQRLMALLTPGVDDLPQHTLRLLERIDAFVDERARVLGLHRDQVQFTRRELRETACLSDTHVKVHLRRLVDAELVLVHRARHGRGHAYSAAFDGGATSTTCDHGRSSNGRPMVEPRATHGRPMVGTSSTDESPTIAPRCDGIADSTIEKRTSRAQEPTAPAIVREPPETH